MIKSFKKIKDQSGYIALISILIVAALILTISLAVTIRGMENLQVNYTSNQAARAENLAVSCVEEALNHLRKSWINFNQLTLSVGSYSCIINVTEFTAGSASLEAFSDVDNIRQKITVTVDNNLNVIDWQEY